ncbi:type II secretion system protein [Candidatus Daviesbacteria bacterium]|nr:type II secretion system protein [Candidatus Daviesbacteria bacterium]
MSKERGFSLIESLLVVVIIGCVVLLLANIPNALMLVSKSRHMSLAKEIAAKQIEDKRTINYPDIGLGSSPISDARLDLLPQGSGTVIIGVENEDTPDPDDWIPCAIDICTNGEAAKQVTVTVNWVDNNKPQTVILKTMIAEGGINQ